MHRASARRFVVGTLIAALAIPVVSGPVAAASAGSVRQVPLAGTTSPQTGDFTPVRVGDVTQAEFPGQMDEAGGPGPYPGTIVNRSLSQGIGNGVSPSNSGKKAKSNPAFNIGFEGLNLYQQRYARGGNQFSVEPPDQALCVGNGYVVEAVNDVLNVYNTSGASLLPDNTATNIVSGFPRNVNHAVDLNSFFGYAPAINRTTGVRGQFVTDPSCLYDAATQRFFVVGPDARDASRTARSRTVNHIDIAVSQTSDPTGALEHLPDRRHERRHEHRAARTPARTSGDYPHIGADAYGFYVTTNAYPWSCNGFGGAQIYAFSKAQLAAGAANVTMVHIDTSGLVNAPSDAGATQPGFTVWPAQSPGAASSTLANGGTEYFISSNAADEATHPVAGFGGSYTSNQLVVWTLTNTVVAQQRLAGAQPQQQGAERRTSTRSRRSSSSPARARAPATSAPQGYCINDTTTLTIAGTGCWRLLVGGQPAHNEVISRPDSNDTRMQQVMFANGKLWGALDTALNPDGGAQRAGIAWYIVNPSSAKVASRATSGATGYDFTYPAIGVTPSGRGVMAFTATGDATNPSAAYAAIDAIVGVGAVEHRPRRSRVPHPTTASRATRRRSATRRARAGVTTARPRSMATRSGSPASTSHSLRLHGLGRPVLRRRQRRQPARHVRRREPRARRPRRARQLVHAISKFTP